MKLIFINIKILYIFLKLSEYFNRKYAIRFQHSRIHKIN
jgi:hypothetical protein